MIELSVLNVSALAVLRLVAWANVGMALALLVAVGFWLACCCWSDRTMDRDSLRTDSPI